MPFDLATWKAAVRERLVGWRLRMQRFGVESVYTYLCTMTLWPVVEAAKGGDWSALMALGGVVGGVGGNLVANHIQKWKDEVDAAQGITAEVARDSALRDELDTILQALETVTAAKETLPKADREWLVETLRKELARYGANSQTIMSLTGSGAMATTGGAAAGAHGVAVGHDVHGGIITDSTVNFFGGRYTGSPMIHPKPLRSIVASL